MDTVSWRVLRGAARTERKRAESVRKNEKSILILIGFEECYSKVCKVQTAQTCSACAEKKLKGSKE